MVHIHVHQIRNTLDYRWHDPADSKNDEDVEDDQFAITKVTYSGDKALRPLLELLSAIRLLRLRCHLRQIVVK